MMEAVARRAVEATGPGATGLGRRAVSDAPGRTGRKRELLVDAALTIPVAALSVGGTAGEIISAAAPTPPAAGGYLIAVASCAVLVWRRRRPALVALASFVITAGYPLLGYPGWAPSVVLFVAVFSLTAFGGRRAMAGALALCVAAYLVPLVSPARVPAVSPALWGPVLALAWVALLGAATRRRRLDSEDRIRRAAEVAEARARQRMADDRLQIARELHDVLAHTISVITVQSGLAVDALDDDTETVRGALGAIRASSRQALGELRATLTLLRAGQVAAGPAGPEHPGPEYRGPAPRLAQVPGLVERASAAGLAATLDVEVGERELSPALELTAYRVVQEAITNVIRHAHARSVEVGVRRIGDCLRVSVVDDGRGEGGEGPGFGIRGMRERVAALGGTLTVGPGPAGGYEVRAELPI